MTADVHMRELQARQAPRKVKIRPDLVDQTLHLISCCLDRLNDCILDAVPCARRLGFDPVKNACGSALYRIEYIRDSCLYSIYH